MFAHTIGKAFQYFVSEGEGTRPRLRRRLLSKQITVEKMSVCTFSLVSSKRYLRGICLLTRSQKKFNSARSI